MIIGIADYVLPRLRLSTPRRDAEALAALLEAEHGYEVRLIRDREATGEALRRLFERELPAELDEARPVVIYFAGHGTATDSLDEPRGYLVPADGGDRVESLLAMPDVARALGQLRCRHLLVLLDCCFAGAFRWSAGRDVAADEPPTLYRERYDRFLATPAWQVITSAGHDELAADAVGAASPFGHLAIGARDLEGDAHSPFLRALLRGLRGAADAFPRNPDGSAGDGVITATELYLYLRHELATRDAAPERAQTPGLWILPRHAKGEFLFYTPRARLDLPDAPTLSLRTSPYRGFSIYREQHAALFHGRRAATRALVAHVERERLAIVVGRSGSGKSSLVRAGLIPALRAAHPDWQLLRPLRPGAVAARDRATALDAMLDHELDPWTGGAPAVLVIDPLDEVFALLDRAERDRFLARLGALADDGVRVVATLRADLEPAMLASPLGARWDRARFALADMTQDELREAIELPALRYGLTFEPPAMVERLINSVVTMPGVLPLLSFTLHSLYVDCLRRGSHDRTLREPPEADGGGLSRALREHIDRIYDSFDDATRATMRRVLLRMVAVPGSSGATRTIALRRLPLAELDVADPAERARIRDVLDALTGHTEGHDFERTPPSIASWAYGIRLAVRGGSRDDSFIELAHDAIVRDWPPFHAWLADAAPALPLQRAVTASAAQWLADHQHTGYLWRDDPRLPHAERALLAAPHQLNLAETDFLRASRDAHRRGRAHTWRTAAAAIVLATCGLIRVAREPPRGHDTVDTARTRACEHVEAAYVDALHDYWLARRATRGRTCR